MPHHYTPEEYLALEREAEFKSEYYFGEIVAMAGGSTEHSIITLNIGGELRARLKGKPCQALSPDAKVRTSVDGLYAYPDVTVVCGDIRYHDDRNDVIVNPTVLVEVLSPSTEAVDRGRKWAQYQNIESLTDYLLVSQNEPRVEHFARHRDDGQWLFSSAVGLDAAVRIASIECVLPLSEVYDRIAFG